MDEDERSGIVNARYRLQRKETCYMPNILGNKSFPVSTFRWVDIYEEGRDQGKAEAVNVLMRMKLDAQKTPYCGLKAEALLDKAMEEIQK